MKNLAVSEELHSVIKGRARREGRMLSAVVADSFSRYLGDEFPKDCREATLLPAPAPAKNKEK